MSSQKALLAAVRGPRDVVPFAGATFFGLGLAPVAPGTFGTLGGVAVAWALNNIVERPIYLAGFDLAFEPSRAYAHYNPKHKTKTNKSMQGQGQNQRQIQKQK